MKIRISRHAKNNMRLYKINTNELKLSINNYDTNYKKSEK